MAKDLNIDVKVENGKSTRFNVPQATIITQLGRKFILDLFGKGNKKKLIA